MADGHKDFPIFIFSFVAGAALIVICFISKLVRRATNARISNHVVQGTKISLYNGSKKSSHQPHSKKLKKKKYVDKNVRDGKQEFHHPWLLTSLKGHSGDVLSMEFSPNGKYLATCGKDRAILLWSTKDWHRKYHKNVRVNVKYDYASLIRWSPDSKAFIIKRHKENLIEAYKINKADGEIRSITPVVTYPKFHDDDVIGLGISANGKFIMSSSNKTDIVISDLKGTVLFRFDSYLAVNYSTYLSPCGKFIIASGFAPDVKIWQVQFTKSGEFANAARLFDLRGHTSGICDTSFDAVSSKVGTLSKDGTWKLFNLSVEHQKGEDPRLVATGQYEPAEISKIALSPLGDVVAITSGASLSLYFASTALLDITIDDIFSGFIKSLAFDSEGKYVLVSGDRHVRIFHNITGLKAGIESARLKLRQPNNSSALTERLKQQISTAEAFIASISK